MQAIAYYILLPFIYFISLLPFKILYYISDIVFFIIYKVIGYRKQVVLENLTNSFPNKSKKEIEKICSNYYRYLCDLILEAFKKLTMDSRTTLAHCQMMNAPLLDELFEKNKSIILLMGHYGNWEWAGSSFSLSCKHQLHVIYKPLSNIRFEELMRKTRMLFGTQLIKMQNAFKDIMTLKNSNAAFAFIADQMPAPQMAYWTDFLNQETAFFTGAEKIGKKYDLPIVFINILRVKRGYYQIHAELLSEFPKQASENEIIQKYVERLEQEINKMPETWLWSHRRWKHKRP